MTDPKAHARARFGTFAENYVHSSIHAEGEDLARLVSLVAPSADALVLDVATGGGHTALAFAPLVRRVIASDYTPTMLDAAQRHLTAQGAANVLYLPADAERLPLADASVDVVTCRVAAHHFPDCFAFVCEAARVLKRGGVLAIHDHLLPPKKADQAYLEAFERLRDPSHQRAFSEQDWSAMLWDAGLAVEQQAIMRRHANLEEWAARQQRPPAVVARLHILLAQAPRAVAEFIAPTHVGTPAAAFDHVFILMTGRKQ
jgi:ubiquinone/menaquinone biosynthesis C-methylase UbiE